MSTLAFEIRAHGTVNVGSRDRGRFTLRASGDGWALIGPDGSLVFHALGPRGRRRCLEFARARGVLAVFS